LRSDARRRGGSGFGLNIVKHIVTRRGGTVSFEEPGGGTIVHVDLPPFEAQRTADAVAGHQLAMILDRLSVHAHLRACEEIAPVVSTKRRESGDPVNPWTSMGYYR
jgi:light-regulated signal transduction histidine kinase (bacteriophytochrome)